MNRLLAIVLSAAAITAAGCSSVNSRINEKPAVFAGLDPATQSKIKSGQVDIGYTPDMVYLALGTPDQRIQKAATSGVNMTWIYSEYYQDYTGTALVGYRREVLYNPVTRSYGLYLAPVHSDVYQDRVEDRIRVDFKDGKVAAIETAKT